MDVRSRRVISTHAWRGRRRGDQKYPRVGGGALGRNTRSEVVGLAATVFTLAAAFFFDFPVACLVLAVYLVSGFLGPAFCLVAVTLGCLGTSVNS